LFVIVETPGVRLAVEMVGEGAWEREEGRNQNSAGASFSFHTLSFANFENSSSSPLAFLSLRQGPTLYKLRNYGESWIGREGVELRVVEFTRRPKFFFESNLVD